MQPEAKKTIENDPTPRGPEEASGRHVVLVGPPNVGKSALFNSLTGRYVVVSNYPGTTVELTRGKVGIDGRTYGLTDTPGTYGLLPVGEDERVTRRLLLDETPDVVVLVLDAKSLERTLPFALQILQSELPLVVAVNMIDEAESSGVKIDFDALESWLSVPVVATAATVGRGVDELKQAILSVRMPGSKAGQPAPVPPAGTVESGCPVPLLPVSKSAKAGAGEELQAALDELEGMLAPAFEERARLAATLLLLGDDDLDGVLPDAVEGAAARAQSLRRELADEGEEPEVSIMRRYHDVAREWASRNVGAPEDDAGSIPERLHRLVVSPWTGIPILLGILYVGLYGFVGVFGAGVVVHLIEDDLFQDIVNPWVDARLLSWLPGDEGWRYWIRELIGGDYGIIPLGLTYAIAIVLPIVTLFFLFFSVLEDSGYFPRLALLVDRLFKRIGLNGRAVIPIVLGFACDTMATLVTRVQESRRERIITTFLLALAVPCSAQYGVIVAVLVGRGAGVTGISVAFLAWALIVGVVFIIAGALASRLVPGEPPGFYMELPPMRLPRPSHVLIKTFARMKWYFMEILPIFLLASVLIWLGRLTGVFELLTGLLNPVVGLLGLPEATSEIFLYGFFRRDFGAAGLFDLTGSGMLDTGQVLVAAVTLTLFMPCVAQVLIMYRERGPKVTGIVIVMVIATAFAVGLMVRGGLELLGVLT